MPQSGFQTRVASQTQDVLLGLLFSSMNIEPTWMLWAPNEGVTKTSRTSGRLILWKTGQNDGLCGPGAVFVHGLEPAAWGRAGNQRHFSLYVTQQRGGPNTNPTNQLGLNPPLLATSKAWVALFPSFRSKLRGKGTC